MARHTTFLFAITIAGCVVVATAVGASICLFSTSRPPPVGFKVTAAVSDAKFRVRDSTHTTEWIKCPEDYSDPRPSPIYEHSRPVLYLDVSLGGVEYHGRVHMSYWGGISSSGSTEVDEVESLDGSAYVVRKGDVFFFPPVAQTSLLSCSLWTEKSCKVDDKTVPLEDGEGVVQVARGSHTLETESWSFELDGPEGFSVAFFEWGENDDEAIAFNHQTDQFKSAIVTFDDDERVSLAKLERFPGFRADHMQLNLIGIDGARFSLEVRRKRPTTHMYVRVSRGVLK